MLVTDRGRTNRLRPEGGAPTAPADERPAGHCGRRAGAAFRRQFPGVAGAEPPGATVAEPPDVASARTIPRHGAAWFSV